MNVLYHTIYHIYIYTILHTDSESLIFRDVKRCGGSPALALAGTMRGSQGWEEILSHLTALGKERQGAMTPRAGHGLTNRYMEVS